MRPAEGEKHNAATQNLQCRQFPVGAWSGKGGGGCWFALHSMRQRFGGVPLRCVALLWFCCGNKIHHNGIISGRTKRKAIHTDPHTQRAITTTTTRKKGQRKSVKRNPFAGRQRRRREKIFKFCYDAQKQQQQESNSNNNNEQQQKKNKA